MAEPRKQSTSGIVVGRSQRDRAKSLNDIYAQRDRIIRGSQGNSSRINQAVAIANGYARNIQGTAQYAFDSLPLQDRVNVAVQQARQKGYTTAAQANADEELTRIFGRYRNDFFNTRIGGAIMPGTFSRQYPRSVYARRNNRR